VKKSERAGRSSSKGKRDQRGATAREKKVMALTPLEEQLRAGEKKLGDSLPLALEKGTQTPKRKGKLHLLTTKA